MTCINYFQLIGDVIKDNIQSIADEKHIGFEDAHKEVLKYLMDNSAQWKSGRKPEIHYEDPLCRIAYLYGIVPVNANLIQYVFERCNELKEFMDNLQRENGRIDICAFGGGPGTELLGLAKWIEKRELGYTTHLRFLMLDQVNEWIDSQEAIQRQMESRFKSFYGKISDWPLNVSKTSCPIDITSLEKFANLGAIFGQDIYIFSYVISEIFNSASYLRKFTTKIAEKAPRGSIFVFIERREARWIDEIRLLTKDAGINISEPKYTKDSMDTDEEKTDIGRIYLELKKIHGRKYDPRITWDAFYMIGTKY